MAELLRFEFDVELLPCPICKQAMIVINGAIRQPFIIQGTSPRTITPHQADCPIYVHHGKNNG